MQALDSRASQANETNLDRALVAFAAARGLNAIVSVAQETEIAVQPTGVGVTIGVGQVLDPLNDLIERFAWVVMLAAISLGVQALLIVLAASTFFNVLATIAGGLIIVGLWVKTPDRFRVVRSLCWLILFVRFVFATVTISVGWIDELFLADRQIHSLDVLETTGAELETLEADRSRLADPTLMERFTGFAESMDLDAQLEQTKVRVERSVGELITLASTFVLQTVVFPIGFLWLLGSLFRRLVPVVHTLTAK